MESIYKTLDEAARKAQIDILTELYSQLTDEHKQKMNLYYGEIDLIPDNKIKSAARLMRDTIQTYAS